ncbi:MAG: 50S ribosomal protein L25 [Anaerolineaceae bacterium]|nr:50S ribosomal protein L25 [Anaerolineaceae bacterium]
MDNKVVINATKRTVTGRKVNRLRRQGKLPGVMYGSNFESTPIFMDLHDVTLRLRGVSKSTLLTINLDGEEYTTLLQDRQKNFVRGNLTHIDFRVVDLNVVITALVRLRFVGEAPVLTTMGGVLITNIQEIEVEALPGDLPETLDVDISSLDSYSASISVADIDIPAGVSVLTNLEEKVASVVAPVIEEEEETVEDELLGEEGDAEPEVIEKGKQEEEIED